MFKELKQHLNPEALNSKDRHAVQVFAWASLLALAVSRSITIWLCPLVRLVGLAPALRPTLMSRALRGSVRILARAITLPTRQAVAWLQYLAEELLAEIRTRDINRDDSFKRMIPLLGAVS